MVIPSPHRKWGRACALPLGGVTCPGANPQLSCGTTRSGRSCGSGASARRACCTSPRAARCAAWVAAPALCLSHSDACPLQSPSLCASGPSAPSAGVSWPAHSLGTRPWWQDRAHGLPGFLHAHRERRLRPRCPSSLGRHRGRVEDTERGEPLQDVGRNLLLQATLLVGVEPEGVSGCPVCAPNTPRHPSHGWRCPDGGHRPGVSSLPLKSAGSQSATCR